MNPNVAAPAESWQRTLSSVAEALFESERGPAEPERVAWVVDDIDHFLMTVGGRTRLVIRLAVETVGRLGPLAVGSLGPFERLSLAKRQAALARLERSPAGLTVFAGVEPALLAGVVVAVGLLLRNTARPHWAEVGRLPGTEVFRNVRRFAVQTQPHVLALRIDESLVFTNSRWLVETLLEQVLARPALRHVVLMMPGVNGIDLTGLEALRQLAAELHARGIALHLSELKGPVADRLAAADLPAWLTGEVFRTQHEADMALVSRT